MKATTCIEAFAEGQVFSQRHPRDQGAYKLAEKLWQWKESEHEVRRIAAALKYPSARYDLMRCIYQDKHKWLRQTLVWHSYQLTANIIPSFKALTGDGMTQSQINQLLPHVERRCQEVMQELERARLTIKGNIKDEYARMRHGASVVGDALAHARELLEEIIDLGPAEIRHYIYRPVEEVI
jgi:hypothetical protein